MVGEIIRRARFIKGLSLGALSLQAGVHKSTLSRWESGKSIPYTEELERVFSVLTISEETQRACWSALGVPRAERVLTNTGQDPLQDMAITGGELLHALRLRAQLSQEDAARAIGVTQGMFSQWEHNDAWPTAEKLERLCVMLGATIDETSALKERRWCSQGELPRDKEAMDFFMDQLHMQDTVLEKGLVYLALAGRYWQLYREHQISEIDTLGVWGHYGDHLGRIGMLELGGRVARGAYETIAKTKGALTTGQLHAFAAIVDADFPDDQGLSRKLAMRRALEYRIPQKQRSFWLDNLAINAGRLHHESLFRSAYEASADAAETAASACMRRQRYARMLCGRGLFTEALQQLEKNASAAVDSRVSVVVERRLIYTWALGATGDRTGARHYLDSMWELINKNPYFYGRDDSIEMAQGLTTKLSL